MTKRMGQSSLGAFSTTPKPKMADNTPVSEPPPKAKPKAIAPTRHIEQEKLVTVNIKIARSQQEWLADTARLVRDNNDEPVPPNERTYPQHLIQLAIELLKSTDLDWQQVRNVDEIKAYLNL